MKGLLACVGMLIAATAFAQTSPQKAPPKSPPAIETATIGGKTITITYSSPRVNGRAGHIFGQGGLINHNPNYPIWRAGANAATALHTEADIELGGLKVPKGDYTLFVDISEPDNWVLIVNKQTGQWGLTYDKKQDLGRIAMGMDTPPALVEDLKYTLTDLGNGKGALTLAWENVSGVVAITVH